LTTLQNPCGYVNRSNPTGRSLHCRRHPGPPARGAGPRTGDAGARPATYLVQPRRTATAAILSDLHRPRPAVRPRTMPSATPLPRVRDEEVSRGADQIQMRRASSQWVITAALTVKGAGGGACCGPVGPGRGEVGVTGVAGIGQHGADHLLGTAGELMQLISYVLGGRGVDAACWSAQNDHLSLLEPEPAAVPAAAGDRKGARRWAGPLRGMNSRDCGELPKCGHHSFSIVPQPPMFPDAPSPALPRASAFPFRIAVGAVCSTRGSVGQPALSALATGSTSGSPQAANEGPPPGVHSGNGTESWSRQLVAGDYPFAVGRGDVGEHRPRRARRDRTGRQSTGTAGTGADGCCHLPAPGAVISRRRHLPRPR
jgi:hypothetical protein